MAMVKWWCYPEVRAELVLAILLLVCMPTAWGQGWIYLSCIAVQPYEVAGTEFNYSIDEAHRQIVSGQLGRIENVMIAGAEVSWDSVTELGSNKTSINRLTGRFLISAEFGVLFRGTCEAVGQKKF